VKYINYIIYVVCVITGFRREVDENIARLSYYVRSSGNSFQIVREQSVAKELSLKVK